MHNDTTRMFPRSAVDAFKGPDYRNSIEGPVKRKSAPYTAVGWTLAIAAAFLLGGLLT